MNQSFTLGRIAGIKILMHWTFLLLLAWIIISEVGRGRDAMAIAITVAFVLAIFLCVVLHELGHSLTAKRFGISTKKITLLPIGGVASLEKMPDDPKQELLIAVAGPAVNVVIAIILSFFVSFQQIEEAEEVITGLTADNFVRNLLIVNIILVVFNAIPAFPMDGGRVLRSLLAFKMDRVKATNIAASIGKFFAVAFMLLGLFGGNFLLVLVGLFVFFGAYAENVIVQHLDLMKGYTVRDAMMTKITLLSPEDTVKGATEKLLAGSDQDFLVTENGQVLGILTRDKLIGALQEKNHDLPVGKVMETAFRMLDANEKLSEVYSDSQRTRNFFSPVMENNRLIGAINNENLNEFVMVRSALRMD